MKDCGFLNLTDGERILSPDKDWGIGGMGRPNGASAFNPLIGKQSQVHHAQNRSDGNVVGALG